MRILYFLLISLITISVNSQNCEFVENNTSNNIISDSLSTYGVKIGDIDGDSDLDVVTIHGHNRIYVKFNDGTGVFGEPDDIYMGGDYFRLELVDVDNDNDSDIVALSFGINGKTDVWKNDGLGLFSLFETVSTGIYANHSKLADLDGDGDLDLFQTARAIGVDNDEQIFKNDGNGHFSLFSTIVPNTYKKAGVALADFDGDGDIDAVMSSSSSSSDNEYWTNDGNGNFTYVTSFHDTIGSGFYGVAHGDFDNDGDEDFVINAQYESLIFYLNDGAGNFTLNSRAGNNIYRNDVQVTDMNNDGNFDVVSAGEFELLTNDGIANFDSCFADDFTFNYSFNTGDLNGDGYKDVYLGVSAYHSDRVLIQKPSASNISNLPKENSFTIFPNPSTNYVQVTLNYTEQNENINILDITGKIILSTNSKKIDISILEKGIYYIKIGNEVQKLIKK